VQPGAVLGGQVGQGVQRVEVARVHLARVRDDHGRGAVEPDQAPAHRLQVDPAGRVPRVHLDAVASVAEHLQRLAGARMHVAAGQHGHPGQPGQAVADGVRTESFAPPLGGAAQRGEVRERRAGDQGPAPAGRQREQLPQPVQRDGLRLVRERRGHPGHHVLVEQGGGPVRGERRRGGSAGDEVEEAGAGRGGAGRGADAQQPLDDLGGAAALVGEPAAEAGEQIRRGRVLDRPVGERVEVRSGGVADLGEYGARGGRVGERIGHARSIPRRRAAFRHPIVHRPGGKHR
jgi:hypothetical protein